MTHTSQSTSTTPMRMSILSERSADPQRQIKTGGKIRPGIKVLTNKAAKNEKAVAIYNEGVLKREKFTDIEKKITAATGLDYPLYPRNSSSFNVAASDFGMPEIADKIVEMFGEIRGDDKVKRLYRFPIVFHSDDLSIIYPNKFIRYGGEPNYQSTYGADGVRYCQHLEVVTPESAQELKAKRIKRSPRRDMVIRGKCQPALCHEFQAGQCRFRGTLHFHIPGIPSTGLMSMETSSEYAAETIWSELERIYNALGHIPRGNPNRPGAPIFYMTKVEEKRTYFDENGNKMTGMQWVPRLQADIDLGYLIAAGVQPSLPASTTPVSWIAAPKGMPGARVMEAAHDGQDHIPIELPSVTSSGDQSTPQDAQVDAMDRLNELIDSMSLDDQMVAEYLDIRIGHGWESDDEMVSAGAKQLQRFTAVSNKCASDLIWIAIKLDKLDVHPKDFHLYAETKFGADYGVKESLLAAIVQDLMALEKLPAGAAAAKFKGESP